MAVFLKTAATETKKRKEKKNKDKKGSFYKFERKAGQIYAYFWYTW